MRSAAAEVPARAALAGNPSDGYGGRTLAVTLPAFAARAEVEPAARTDVEEPLPAAALRRFAYATGIDPGPLRIRCSTTIPEQVGLAGSSAIVVAVLRALAAALEVELSPPELAVMALQAETRELGIAAGPQDRVVQAHGGLVAMDFDPRHGPAGAAERLDPALLPPLFVAWQRTPAASSGVFHAELRRRHDSGDPVVCDGIRSLADLAAEARDALVAGDHRTFARCMDGSYDVRSRMASLDRDHVRMVEVARSLGAAANFAGSGGAIVGTMPPGIEPAELGAAFASEGCASTGPVRMNWDG